MTWVNSYLLPTHGWRLVYLVIGVIALVALQVWLRTGDRKEP